MSSSHFDLEQFLVPGAKPLSWEGRHLVWEPALLKKGDDSIQGSKLQAPVAVCCSIRSIKRSNIRSSLLGTRWSQGRKTFRPRFPHHSFH